MKSLHNARVVHKNRSSMYYASRLRVLYPPPLCIPERRRFSSSSYYVPIYRVVCQNECHGQMSTYCQGCWVELFRLFLGPSPHHHSSSPAVALGSGDKINQTVEIRFRTDNNHNASDKDPGRFIPKHSLSDLHSHLDDIFWSRTTRARDTPTTETLTPSPCGRRLSFF